MVGESVERSFAPEEGESNVIRGPWSGPAYLDPDKEEFFLPRVTDDQGEPIRVYATAACTALIWQMYKEGLPLRDWAHLLLGWSGEPIWQDREGTKATRSHDPQAILQAAMTQGTFVYNFRRKRAWRPVWYPSIPLAERHPSNVSFEVVELFGYKSFLEEWAKRPRAKLFKND